MNTKEAFLKAKAHLLKQGQRSSRSGSCFYRGPNGTMCAIGCLIPDEQYNEGIENHIVDEIWDTVPILRGLDREMLTAIQDLHDQESPEDWEKELERLELIYAK